MSNHIASMIVAGWTVTFQPFNNNRAFAVEATKGTAKHTRGWINEATLEDAIERLSEDVRLDECNSKTTGGG